MYHYILFLLLISYSISELIYDEPVYNLQTPNFTLGGLFQLTTVDSKINTEGIDRAISMMCTLKVFNSGDGSFPLTGIFNGLVYDSSGTVKQSEYSAMKLLAYNFRDSNSGQYVSTGNDLERIQVGAIIADLDTNVFFATQPVFSGFPFTFLGVQFLDNGIGTNNTLQPHPVFKARVVPQSFVISAAASASIAEAIVSMLLYFSWTLVTVVYSRDTFGMEGQAFFQPLLQENSILTVCSIITKTSEEEAQIQSLADCLNENDSRVVVLWGGASSKILAQFCRVLQSKTKYKLVFISPGSDTTEYVASSTLEPISTSFLFKNLNVVPFSNAFEDCLASTQPANQSYFNSQTFQKYWQEKFKCPEGDDQCIKQSALQATIEMSQVSDSTMLILKAISLMQNNCTLLNNILNMNDLNPERNDYCEKDEFSASDIYGIVNLVLYLGLPAFLTLGNGNSSSTVSTKSLQVLQVNGTGQLVPVGNYSTDGVLKINNASLFWTTDSVPESSVSISNPSFDDAIVVVFFSFAVLGILVSCLLKVLFVIYRNEKVIRKSSPLFNFLILIGIDLVLVSLIFYGVEYTTATCFLYAWLLAIGTGLILANIFVKSYRIYRIFRNQEAVALSIPEQQLFAFICGVLIVEIGLLSIYSFASGLLGPKVIQSSSDIYYKYRICLVPSQGLQLSMLISIYLFNLAILLSVALLAFLSRGIDNSLSESRGIAYTVYNTLLFQLTFLPLIYTAQDSAGSALVRYALTGMIILFSCYTALTFLFYDKIVAIFRILINK